MRGEKRDSATCFLFFGKKKGGVHSEIWLWRDEAWFCGGMIGTECRRRDGAVADSSSFSIVQMFSTISSINSDSRLQMQAKPQLFFLKNSQWSTDHTIKRKWAMKNGMKCQISICLFIEIYLIYTISMAN